MSMLPVRVCVETVRPAHCLSCAHDGQPLMDTYAIVPGSTLLCDLVDIVLSALGQPHLAANSREALFKDIVNRLTLRILTKSGSSDTQSSQCIAELKNRLLKSAVAKQPDLLSSVDNKQIKDIIRQVIDGDDPALLNPDQIVAINEWLDTMEPREERRSPVNITRFSPITEIPKLERWFKSDPNPSRAKLLNYMNVLNGGQYRSTNSKVSYQQLCNYFSNERANKRASSATPSSTSCSISIASTSAAKPPGGSTTPVSVISSLTSSIPASASSASSINFSSGNSLINSILPKAEMPSLNAMIADYRPKFDFNLLFENSLKKSVSESTDLVKQEGGSDSPAQGDDHSVHSTSDGANESEFGNRQESNASSPDVSLLGGVGIPGVPSPRIDPNNMNVARSRLMFDPLTELPVLEKWFEENPHPTWLQIDQYTQMLNSREYRENYPHISQHNVKIWFKNRRAKCKRLQTGINEKMMQLGAAIASSNNTEVRFPPS